jgi:hypothetical protein
MANATNVSLVDDKHDAESNNNTQKKKKRTDSTKTKTQWTRVQFRRGDDSRIKSFQFVLGYVFVTQKSERRSIATKVFTLNPWLGNTFHVSINSQETIIIKSVLISFNLYC